MSRRPRRDRTGKAVPRRTSSCASHKHRSFCAECSRLVSSLLAFEHRLRQRRSQVVANAAVPPNLKSPFAMSTFRRPAIHHESTAVVSTVSRQTGCTWTRVGRGRQAAAQEGRASMDASRTALCVRRGVQEVGKTAGGRETDGKMGFQKSCAFARRSGSVRQLAHVQTFTSGCSSLLALARSLCLSPLFNSRMHLAS